LLHALCGGALDVKSVHVILQAVMDGPQGQRSFTRGATVELMVTSMEACGVSCLSDEVAVVGAGDLFGSGGGCWILEVVWFLGQCRG